MEVSIELRREGGKLYAQAILASAHGPITIDHIFVKAYPSGRPRIELPARPVGGGLWLPVLRLPDEMYGALVAAIERAIES